MVQNSGTMPAGIEPNLPISVGEISITQALVLLPTATLLHIFLEGLFTVKL